jgi:hypothetical protein
MIGAPIAELGAMPSIRQGNKLNWRCVRLLLGPRLTSSTQTPGPPGRNGT